MQEQKGAISYQIKITTLDNKIYKMRISDYEKMKKLKKWLRNARA